MKIVFTGGGTGGHVIPNLAIIKAVRQLAGHAEIFYLGSQNGPEKKLVEKVGVKFFTIAGGKWRRYFSLKNMVDSIKIPVGVMQSIHHLIKIKPNIVFSKGGFVSVPVVIAAAILRIPIIIHESDFSPGLATKIAARFATKICLAFPTARNAGKMRITGNPIRSIGNATHGREFLKFKNDRPTLLVAGGSSGANFLNNLLTKTIGELATKMNIVWLTGRGKSSEKSLPSNVRVFEYLDAEYLDVLAAADLIVSRAGAGAIFEISTTSRPSILIPLPAKSSRGDQIENARFFEKNGAAIVLSQSEAKPRDFTKLVSWLIVDEPRRTKIGAAARKLAPEKSAEKIARIILEEAK